MSHAFSLSPSARKDLQAIDDYIVREHGVAAADRVLAAIVDAIRHYAEWPLTAPTRNELAPELRGVVVAGYMLYYTPRGRGGVRVERIIHGARNQAALFARMKGRRPGRSGADTD